MIEKKTLDSLDWPKLVELSAQNALSQPGREQVLKDHHPSEWAQNLKESQRRQQETLEVVGLLNKNTLWTSLNGLVSIETRLEALKKGSVLDPTDWADIRSWLFSVEVWGDFSSGENIGKLMRDSLSNIFYPREPIVLLEKLFTSDGELSDRASPQLFELRTRLRKLKDQLEAKVDQTLKSLESRGVLQENYSDLRNGRVVVPIKISAQSEVEGMVHGSSVSGQTVFFEPKELGLLNNEILQVENELTLEVYRIMHDLTQRFQPWIEDLGNSIELLSYWDAVQARARLREKFSGKPIQVIEKKEMHFIQSAHPLLWWSLEGEKICSNDLLFGLDQGVLLISGPNTGGKTVFLKMIGIAACCARTGHFFPGTEEAKVPFFENIFVDLGDEQSIERQISSFSGHLLTMKEILLGANEKSLILLDELNTATDPEEGGALARAFLEELLHRRAKVIATTHDRSLKALALENSEILNASMEFDEQNFQPTYQLSVGAPGRSRAIETAERLGMLPSILKRARELLSREHQDFESLLEKLEVDTRKAQENRVKSETLRQDAERLKQKWKEKLDESLSLSLDRAQQKLKGILSTTQEEIRSALNRIKESHSVKDFAKRRAEIDQIAEKAFSAASKTVESESPGKKKSNQVGQLKVGEPVKIPKWNNLGRILEVQGNRLKVSLGLSEMGSPSSLTVTLKKSEVDQIAESEIEKLQKKYPLSKSSQNKIRVAYESGAVDLELDIRGLRLDEAISKVDLYLDRGLRSGLKEVVIIHGLGSGALREGVRKHLSSLSYVISFEDGGAGRGGSGATVVRFES